MCENFLDHPMHEHPSRPASAQTHPLPPQPALPHEIKCFLEAVKKELPPRFELVSGGFKLLDQKAAFCSPLRVRSRAKNQSSGWSLVIEILDPLDHIVTCILPAKTLEGKPREALGLLAEHGWRLFDSYWRDTVLDLLRQWPAGANETELDRTGWTADRAAFLLPDGTVLSHPGSAQRYRFSGRRKAVEVGDLAIWRREVASLFVGNPNLIFACCAALAPALMPFQPAAASRIYHFYEKSSVGKSLILKSGMSVWPQESDGLRTWRTTVNGLERAAANANNTALCLDDLPEDPTAEFGQAIYLIGNDGGKTRMDQNTAEKERLTWKINVLSSGEAKSAVSLEKIGKKQRGGQDVRMIDIRAVAESDGIVYGAFENLHGQPNGRAFAKVLEEALGMASGPAGRAFVEALLKIEPHLLAERLRQDIELSAAALRLAIDVSEDDHGASEVNRVLDSFALVAVAGEWATNFGVTGWEKGVATTAVTEIARRWLKDRGSSKSRDLIEAIRGTREFLERSAHLLITLPAKSVRMASEVLGYKDDAYFYILPKTFADIHAGRTPESIARLLEGAGFLERGGERNSLLFRLRDTGKDRPRAYRIRREIMEE